MPSFLRSLTAMVLFLASVICAPAWGQLSIEISGVGANQIPIAVARFANEADIPQKISEIVKADLARCGLFRIVHTGSEISENDTVNHDEWRARGADALLVGSVQRHADGRFEVRYRLFDTVRSTQLSAQAIAVSQHYLRLSAHKVADDVYEKLTGVPGIFSTRIAYVAKAGSQFKLEIADADGYGRQFALVSKEPIMSPSWSPDGTKVAYVSFESKKPVVYVQDLRTRKRTVIANYRGSNSAPAWSPDGKQLALALARKGLTQLYLADADGRGLRRLTRTSWIDTEPRFSADGQSLYFTSDRSGGPQIYRMSVNGGPAERVTFYGNYNVSPRISPDGKSMAFVSRREGRYQLYLLDLETGQELPLSETDNDESPSFSPNGMYIMYATESGGRGALSVVSVDGRVKHSLSMQAGDIREPTWGPFMK